MTYITKLLNHDKINNWRKQQSKTKHTFFWWSVMHYIGFIAVDKALQHLRLRLSLSKSLNDIILI